MKRIFSLIFCALFVCTALAGCSNTANSALSASSTAVSSQPSTSSESNAVDSSCQAAESKAPITGDSILDGTYAIDVSSSSSMFHVLECQLTVADGQMTAVMTMSGTGYLYIYPGTGEEAANASQDTYIPFEETSDGLHTFTFPVQALDSELNCAAFSKNKEQWYDRTLVFSSSSLPAEAFAQPQGTSCESLNLADGSYTVEVSLSGGSGRSSVDSPAMLTIKNGLYTVQLDWSSPNYDYMLVGGERYELSDQEGNSSFIIPVLWFDSEIPVVADTIAMSVPHEIEYTLIFDSATIQPAV
ncbi:MAG: hypothetical protein MSH10_01480 [Pygmaiobacter massiliensis]|nr:hypothetical protein [Pygmaiobacter massiliensis]